jgi:nucleotide-binding universal stress UspA family protein
MSEWGTGRIVVGLDDSASARTALVWAATVAAGSGCPFTLVHGYPDVSGPPMWGWREISFELQGEARTLTDEAEQFLRASAGVAEVSRIVQPEPPAPLLRAASEGAAMVVVGRHGTGGVLDKLVGSTAYSVAEHADAPVVVVPESWTSGDRAGGPVVLGLDDAYDAAALAFAHRFAGLTGVKLVGVHASRAPALTAREDEKSALDEWLAERRDWLQAELESRMGDLVDEVPIVAEVAVGSPVDVLLERARDASLVVIGGRRRHRRLPAPFGSVARALLHACPCPLAIAHSTPATSGVPNPS